MLANRSLVARNLLPALRRARIQSWLVVGVMLGTVCLSGCRWGKREGPVPQALLASRQLSQEGVAALEKGDAQGAATLLSRAIKTCPADCEARRHYADVLSQMGRKPEAIAQLTEALNHEPDDDAAWVKLAELQMAQGDIERARFTAAHALTINGENVGAWIVQARARRRQGELRESLADFHRALHLDAENRELLWEISETYRQLGEPQRALANLQKLSDTYNAGDEPQQLLYQEGLTLLALGRHAESVESLTKARDRAPPSPDLLFHLAEAQLRVGQSFDAKAALGQALALDPQHASSRALIDRLETARSVDSTRR